MPVKFEFENPFLRTWLLLHQTYNMVLKCEDRVFAKHGLSTEQHSVVLAIKYIDGPVTPTDVARWLDRNTNSISLIVDRMVKRGLVRGTRYSRDRRRVQLAITGQGKEILDQATVAGWELMQEVLSPLSEEQMCALIGLLESVRGKAFEFLNPGEVMEEIRRNETKNMARFMKRVAEYGSSSAFASKKPDSQVPPG